MDTHFLFYQLNPMSRFVVGDFVDIHGRRSLYYRIWKYPAGISHREAWLRWVSYLN